ncbi:MAG: antitoxin [Gammaproteobacteria bacterium]|nr:antitoxin [Gammaproteobacteria bacterium]
MSLHTISATNAARSFSKIMNSVRYQGESFLIERGHEIVAQIIPPTTAKQIPIAELNRVFSEAPKLSKDDADDFLNDIYNIRAEMSALEDKWES